MYDPIVKDSSIWVNSASFAAVNARDAQLKIGIVRDIQYNKGLNDVRYVVEISDDTNLIPVVCIPISRWGGAHNFEEFTLRGYKPTNKPGIDLSATNNKPGDVVIVAYLAGDGRQGVILGGLKHPARPRVLNETDGVAYHSRFNGLVTTIDDDGAWTTSFNGKATNENKLNKPPNTPVPVPTYDSSIAGSFMKFLKDGSWEVSDSATQLSQGIKIDKQGGVITITSGKITVVLKKSAESITATCKTLTVNAGNLITQNTKEFKVNAASSVSLKSPKVAIGSGSVELLDHIVKLIDALGKVFVMTPTGATSPLEQSPLWLAVKEVRNKIDSIKGTLG